MDYRAEAIASCGTEIHRMRAEKEGKDREIKELQREISETRRR